MKFTSRSIAALVLSSLVSIPASAQNTWIVDQSNGPGTNFTSLSAAVTTVADGDVLIIRAGPYAAFTLDNKGMTLLGEPGVEITPGDLVIKNLPTTKHVVLSRMALKWYFKANDCAGALFLDEVHAGPAWFTNCADVRARLMRTTDACTLSTSRFETHFGLHYGSNLGCCAQFPGEDGIRGLGAYFGSSVHLVSCALRGGRAYMAGFAANGCNSQPGEGGAGLYLSNSSALFVRSGRNAVARGGEMGHHVTHFVCGNGGSGVLELGTSDLRYSGGVNFIPWPADPFGALCSTAGAMISIGPGSTASSPSDRDPALDLRNRPFSGSPIELSVFGPAGSSVTLVVGNQLSITPTANVLVPVLTTPQQVLALGLIPASEIIQYSLNVGPQTTGALVVVQAELALPSGEVRRTNSVPIVYR